MPGPKSRPSRELSSIHELKHSLAIGTRMLSLFPKIKNFREPYYRTYRTIGQDILIFFLVLFLLRNQRTTIEGFLVIFTLSHSGLAER